ncbi:MAG: hypothetical protein WDO73_13675 [Ignavibacteriota bacterium]
MNVLCEGNCVLHRYNQKPIEIGRLQRYAMDRFYESNGRLPAVVSTTRHRVACVVGGPASLACAAELARRGHSVTVLRQSPTPPGGLNTYGVAEYKLRAADSLREVELVRSLGVEFRQAEVGTTITLDDLESEFAFVFLGMGLGAMEPLGIPGEGAGGVIDALRFIERYKTSHDIAVGRRVIVIGGREYGHRCR